MKSVLLLFVSVLLFTSSCDRRRQQYPIVIDRLVFATFYGMCAGNCVKLYQVDNTSLRKDDSARYSDLSPDYRFLATRMLGNDRFNITKDLLYQIPRELLETSNKTYGCPDCHDQGGVMVQVYMSGLVRTFRIDNDNTTDQSAEVVAFKQKISAAIHEIQ